MPGPNSLPHARRTDGTIVTGKSAMHRAKLHSRQGLTGSEPRPLPTANTVAGRTPRRKGTDHDQP